MTEINNAIQQLSDEEAQRILITFTRNQPDYQTDPMASASISLSGLDEDLERETLLFLAENPQHRPVIDALVRGPKPQKLDFGVGSAVALTAVVFLLRTHIKYERKADGSWTFKVEHKPAAEGVLKSLLGKLEKILPSDGS